MESLASQAKPVAVLWLAGFLQAARLHRVVSFCASSRALSIRIAQCFLLNGFIFLGSLITLKSVVIPTLLWILPEQHDQLWGQYLRDHPLAVTTYSFLRSGLVEIFYALALNYLLVVVIFSTLLLTRIELEEQVFWFYPLYIFSFILSALWYGDIAKHAMDVVKSKSLDAAQALETDNISESADRPEGFDGVAIGLGEQVYSILLLNIFFAEVTVIGYIPYLGKAMNFLLLSLMYAYYCFEYRWNFFAVNLNKRLDFFESNWAFFAGFGSPCVLPIFFFSPLASYGVMAILYPLFVLTAAGTQADQVIDELKPLHEGKLKRISLFFVAKRLTTQVLQLFPEAQKEQ